MTVIEGMTVFSNLRAHHDVIFKGFVFHSLSRGKISQFWKEFESGKGESLRNRLGRDVVAIKADVKCCERMSLGMIYQIFPVSA